METLPARVRDLIRQTAQIIVNAPPEWLDELDSASSQPTRRSRLTRNSRRP